MNKEELLLTSEEVKGVSGYASWFFLKPYLEAQLDKIVNPEWKDKPDSEGWWWYHYDGRVKNTLKIAYISSAVIRVWNKTTYSLLQAKWSRAIVPEIEKGK